MGKTEKLWLIAAASLILIGCIIFGGVMTVFKWDFLKLSTNKYETNHHEISTEFHAIVVNTDTADITFVPSRDSSCSVVCYEQENAKHSVSVKDGTLVIEVVDTRKWYAYIGINFGTPKITVYLPQGEYGTLLIKTSTADVEIPQQFRFESLDISGSTGDITVRASALDTVKINTSTGNICVENISAGSVDLSVSTGKITVSNVSCAGDANINVSTGKANLTGMKCKNLTSEGSTGDISLNNVLAEETLSIRRSTGDVRFDGVDAAEIFVETDTGDILGSLLTDKVYITHTDTGKVDVPKTVNGGKCEIRTDTGNIKISVQNEQ